LIEHKGQEAIDRLSDTFIVLELKISYEYKGHIETLAAGVVVCIEKIKKLAFRIVVVDEKCTV
jgi:hypothetical protein